ncbi:hypothetical protein C1646_670822 [Rhizophagus diaphanus]|nr:hypothetical protein C1646_670822 [Rhizophagus diaphanus] [Rhizophagus sp. MUCL 43196]
MAFYSCPYTYIDSRVCGKKCYRKEGCHIHWKRQTRIPCGDCGTLMASSYGMCTKHAGKYYSKANYYKIKLQLEKWDQISQAIQELQDKKRDQAFQVIQEYVQNWLYRPGGPIMKNTEARFYITASRQ